MTETTIQLNPESHLLLEQPLLRLPHEISRKNFKSIQRSLEHTRDHTLTAIKTLAANSSTASPSSTLEGTDALLTRLKLLQAQIVAAQQAQKSLNAQTKARIAHLNDLYECNTLTDVKYELWSKVRLDRLLVDYLLRMGYGNSAGLLAKEKGIEELVDLDVFVRCRAVEDRLREGSLTEALSWLSDHKNVGKNRNSSFTQLEFDLRLQQHIELVRSRKLMQARQHAAKYLAHHHGWSKQEVQQAATLLLYPPTTLIEPYKSMYAHSRYNDLADLFVRTHHELFSLPSQPLLHIALSAGLSALKTPACHSQYTASSPHSTTSTVCPICSTELNELAKPLPYAHHSKSYVENDPVVLPNGRVYGRERLVQYSAKMGLPEGILRDLVSGEDFDASEARKIFLS